MTTTPAAPVTADGPDSSDGALIDAAQVHTLQQLGVALSQLRARAGRPSLRTLDKGSRNRHDKVPLARQTISRLLRGERLASKDITMALVCQLGADDDEVRAWERAWQRVSMLKDSARTPPPRSELAELREVIAELQQTVTAQHHELDRLHGRLTQLEGDAASRPSPSASTSGIKNTADRRKSSSMLQWRIQEQMEATVPQAAREALKELAGEVVAKAYPQLEIRIRDHLDSAVPQTSRETVKKLAVEIAAKAYPQLEIRIRDYLDSAVPQAARDAVTDIARDLS
ncbi:hypothetical protein [Streptosporangium subroseum]|uniref:hypothetical protein n=1 Tax=Streptosporangium subroseum TaxID=106412 RepID=UPI0030854485|nr:hypothetical protein OHB15_50410 [Streptosporangium subroseum]